MSRLNTADDEAVFGVVGDAHRLVVALDADHRLHRPERLLAVDAHLRRDMVEHRRLDDGAGALAAGDHLAALGDCVGDEGVHPLGRREIDQRAEHDMAARIAGRQLREALAASLATKASAIFSSTMMRSVDMQIWPWFMKAPKAAAFTAASMSASSSTISGALPPSSSSTGFRCLPASSAMMLPTRSSR